MPKIKDRNDVKKWPLYLGLAVASLGIVTSFVYSGGWLPAKIGIAVVAEIGFAFIIAYVIIVTIDAREKYEFRKTIEEKDKEFEDYSRNIQRRLASRSMMSYILDLDLPQSVSDCLPRMVSEQPIMKEYQQVNISIEMIDDEKVFSKTYFDYIAKNVGDKKITYPLKVFAENQEVENIGASNYSFGVEIFEVYKKTESDENFQKVNSDIDDVKFFRDRNEANADVEAILELELNPGDEFKVVFSHHEKKSIRDNVIWQNLILCERLEVRVDYPSEKIELYQTLIHPELQAADIVQKNGLLKIDFRKPMFLRQGFLLWWVPKQHQTPLSGEE